MRLRLGERLTRRWRGLHLSGRTIRLRLTLVYGGLFLASGAVLLATTYVLVRHATGDVLVGTRGNVAFALNGKKVPAPARPVAGAGVDSAGKPGGSSTPTLTPAQAAGQLRRDAALAKSQHDAELHQLLDQSEIALAIMAAISMGLGWIVAGRVLSPLRTITEAAREISATNLHRRLALEGPDDELMRLGNTFDALLERLEAAFATQRQFVSNASHELRTPVAFERTLLQVALADPKASAETLRATCEQLLDNSQHHERLIKSLLTLSRSQRGLDQRESFDLAATTDAVLEARRSEAERRGLLIHATLAPAETTGDPHLTERLVINLIDNAIHHNNPHGHLDVTTTTRSGRAVLSVANSGPLIPPDQIERLFRPFQRLGADRTGHSNGVGLGLSIVQAVAAAHDATLTALARQQGGLEIEVGFPSLNPVTTVAASTVRHRPARV